MSRTKGSGKKSKLSVTVDKAITDTLDQHCKTRGEKSELVNRILTANLNFYLLADFKPNVAIYESSESPDQSVTFEVSAARREVEKRESYT